MSLDLHPELTNTGCGRHHFSSMTSSVSSASNVMTDAYNLPSSNIKITQNSSHQLRERKVKVNTLSKRLSLDVQINIQVTAGIVKEGYAHSTYSAVLGHNLEKILQA